MNKQKLYTFDDHFKELMKNPVFKKDWQATKPERLLGNSLMDMINLRKSNYKKLSNKTKISEKTIGDIILGFANPKLSMLKKIATSLNSKLILKLESLIVKLEKTSLF